MHFELLNRLESFEKMIDFGNLLFTTFILSNLETRNSKLKKKTFNKFPTDVSFGNLWPQCKKQNWTNLKNAETNKMFGI